ncbi:MAG: CocE/NonD family hydrolase [Bacteroidales bacterium]|nr:CocE/NonD family hydrolase [Candidatus Latescibacterota bacterium]
MMRSLTGRWAIGASVVLSMLVCSLDADLQAADEQVGNMIQTEQVMIPMRDGVELSGALYLPEAGDVFPVILVRTPYGKRQLRVEAEFWAAGGYAVLIQDARGKFASGGDYLPFVNELADGMATLDWIMEQPWCNGKIGMWGSSYLAFSQLILASKGHPGLRSIFPVSGWLGSEGQITCGGANHIMLSIPWILHEESLTNRNMNDYEIDEMFEYLPILDAFKSVGIDSRIWNEKYELEELDVYRPEDIEIPALHMTGWLDFVAESALGVYRGIDAAGRKGQLLIVGPWFHDQFYSTFTEAGDEDFGPQSVMGRAGLMELSKKWFDMTLRGMKNDLSEKDRVTLFVMGADEWRGFDQWPPVASKPRKFFFSSMSGANSLDGDGSLSCLPLDDASFDTFTFDPMDPVPTNGGANMHFMLHLVGVKDQRDIERRDDVLVYTSEPLEDDMEIIGAIEARIYVSTEGLDTDFTAKLVEVREDGYARIIEEGIVRASWRNGGPDRELLEPGKVYGMNIAMGSTAILIKAGNRLRVEISSSNFPKYDRNPNTGEDPLRAAVLKKTRQKIYHGKKYPSHIVLPVMDEGVRPGR